ncbi:C6 transcription factor [Fusarium sp. NRRL 25303]|nr:C6 transcription factor [Fusarium sp. NRRL 25303]
MATELRPGAPVPRARTVASACDACKRRKLKCSGEQPCQRCNAGTVMPLDYIRHLESRVADLEAQLAGSAPRSNQQAVASVDLSEANLQANASQTLPDAVDTLIGPRDDFLSSFDGSETYHGAFASLNVLRILRDKCDSLANIMAPLSSGRVLAEAFAKEAGPSPVEQVTSLAAELPELAECQRLCHVAIEEALPCHECIDREAFFARLIQATVAIPVSCTAVADMKHRWGFYQSSIQMLQLDDLCSLDILRAIIYQVLLLSANCMLSKAYTRLSIGVATALRIGLHVSGPSLDAGIQLPAEQMFRRRQVFSVLYAIDTYLASTLGVPKLFHQVDTDQILPLRDESLHDHGISFVRQNPHTPEAETLVVCRILVIMAEIHKLRDPFGKSIALNGTGRTYKLTSQDVASLDAQLTEWYNSLPPVKEIPPVRRALHAQLAIRHTYAITQMALHRPFLHHLTRKADDQSFCMEGYAYGSQCITAAMQTVWLLQRLDDQGLLHESIWFYISSLAFAASSLIFFVLGSPYSTTVRDATQAAFKAHGLLEKLAQKNETAKRCFESIDFLMARANLDVHEQR